MITYDSPFGKALVDRAVLLEDSLKMIHQICWKDGDDMPSESLDPDALEDVKDILKRAAYIVEEITTANYIVNAKARSTSNRSVDDMVSSRGAPE